MRSLAPLVVFLFAGPVAAQQVVETGSVPTCTRCGIFLTRAVTLSDTAGAAALTLPDEVAIDARGRYLVASAAAPGEIGVFDPDGDLIGIAGGFGDAPGQFRRIGEILVHGDTIHVFDVELSRWTLLDGDFGMIRTVALPRVPLRTVFWNGDLVINARGDPSDPGTSPIHVVTSSGAITRSFGRDTVSSRAEIPHAAHRLIAACPNGTLWWARLQEYRLTAITRDGGRTVLNRSATWFTPHESEPLYTVSGGPPPSMLAAMRCDAQNRLWILSNVADPQWRTAGLTPEQEDPQTGTQVRFDPERYFDTVIDIIDTTTGELVTTLRTGQYFDFFLAPGLFGLYTETEGLAQVEIWRADLLQLGQGA